MVVVQEQKTLVGPACALSQGMRYYYFIKEIYIKCSDDAMIQTVQHWFLKGLLTVVSWPKIWLVIENTTSTPPSVCRYFRHEFLPLQRNIDMAGATAHKQYTLCIAHMASDFRQNCSI